MNVNEIYAVLAFLYQPYDKKTDVVRIKIILYNLQVLKYHIKNRQIETNNSLKHGLLMGGLYSGQVLVHPMTRNVFKFGPLNDLSVSKKGVSFPTKTATHMESAQLVGSV